MRRLLLATVLAAALLCLLAAPALAKTVTVAPNHDASGTTDTLNLQRAFATAGPGGTVQLTAGHFTIKGMLVKNFHGTFTGAGKGKTVIGCPDGGVKLESGMDFTYLLCFQGGAVTVSDMSFDITSSAPAQPFSWDDFGSGLTFIEAVLYLDGQTSAAVERVGFTGCATDDPGSFSGYNVDQSVTAQGVQVCTMGGCTCATAEGFFGELSSDAQVTVGGPCQGNVFDTPLVGCLLYDYNDSQAAVRDNRFVCHDVCVSVIQDPGTSASHYLISDNYMREPVFTSAIGLSDGANPGASPEIAATVANNHLDVGTAQDPAFAGVAEADTQNIRCYGNVLSGYATAGFALGGDPTDDSYFPVSGWQIIGNDCRNLNADADVWLGLGTTHCLVSASWLTTVADQGSHNILINCQMVPPPSDPTPAATPMNSLRQLKLLKGMMRP